MRPPAIASPPRPDRPAWLVSFADLIALMLAFFVLLYAMQRIESGDWKALVDSLSRSLRPGVEAAAPQPAVYENVESVNRAAAADLGYIESLLRSQREGDAALDGILLRRFDDRLVIMLPSDLLFRSGAFEPMASARDKISRLAAILHNVPNRIDVYGHTDPNPVGQGRLRTNWELSLARAVAVAGQLHAFGYRRPIAAFGVADTRMSDIALEVSRERQFSLARRVDIVVRPNGGDES